MQLHRPIVVLIVTTLMLTMAGCEEEERLAEMAERHLERQAEQNRQIADLQKEVAEGTRQLVEADARAREEMVALQRDLQADQAAIGQQRDQLEGERKELAAKRRLDPLVAAAITNIGLLAVCALPLILCWYLLYPRVEPADDQVVAEVLLQDLVSDRPLLLPRIEDRPAIGSAGEASSLSGPSSDQPASPND